MIRRIVLASLLASSVASAGQHQNGNVHQWWTVQAPAYSIDQGFTFRAMADATYFALVVWYQNTSDGAYMGVQQLGDGSRVARFSVWNSTSAQPGAGATCRDFDGEGIGKTCEIPFPFELDHPYRYRMWKLSNDGAGWWWGAWMIDDVTHAETLIGQIRAPNPAGDITGADTFDEYFGDAVPCDAVPWSEADISVPALSAGAAHATAATPTMGNCSAGLVSTVDGSLRIELGSNHAGTPPPPPPTPTPPGPGSGSGSGSGSDSGSGSGSDSMTTDPNGESGCAVGGGGSASLAALLALCTRLARRRRR